jgi:basic membrane lipoprotein Med (substrate-binding protein (PBP1-ABC) superfamily)
MRRSKRLPLTFCIAAGLLAAAPEGPAKTTFMHATGYKTAANVGVYNGRFYEARYLNGVVAGRMTRTARSA